MTQEFLKEIFDYDPDIGKLIWRVYAGNKCVKPFTDAGYLHSLGYTLIQVNKKAYKAHRLIWLWYYGRWPKQEIDHINHNRNDNRICNLREVSHGENCRNSSLYSKNTSGQAGVSFYKRDGNWQAYINSNGKRISLGKFATLEEAIKARKEAEKKYNFHENHGTTYKRE